MKDFVANNLYEIRVKKGVTQEQLARKIGITRQTVIAIEKGNYTPSVLLALKIGRFFDMKVEDLFIIKK